MNVAMNPREIPKRLKVNKVEVIFTLLPMIRSNFVQWQSFEQLYSFVQRFIEIVSE